MQKDLNRFDRIEKKYLLTEEEHDKLMNLMNSYLVEDEYYISHIANIYLDDDNFSIIGESMERPFFKEKMRLRSYNAGEVFVEIKRKYNGEVYKRRIRLSQEEAFAFVKGESMPKLIVKTDIQIANEIKWFLNYHKCNPKMYLAYDRRSYKGRDDPSLRITFDTDIRYRVNKLSFEDEKENIYVLGKGQKVIDQDGRNLSNAKYIMEIKAGQAFPLWLCGILDELHIYPISFSKYATCYLHMKKGNKSC